MVIPSSTDVLPFLQTQGYLIIFVIMFFEGPIVTYAAAFASSLGYLNPWIIIILSVLGNVTPDLIYYTIGKYAKKERLYKILKRLGVKRNKVHKLVRTIHNHAGKMMLTIKVVPTLPPPGLIMAGMIMKFKKFITLSIIISAAYSLVFFVLGYYSGKAYLTILPLVKWGGLIIAILVVIFLTIWLLGKYLLRKKLED